MSVKHRLCLEAQSQVLSTHHCVFIRVQYAGKRRRRKTGKEIPNNLVTVNKTTASQLIIFLFP